MHKGVNEVVKASSNTSNTLLTFEKVKIFLNADIIYIKLRVFSFLIDMNDWIRLTS